MNGYFKAAIPEPYRILGLQLRPLSLGRYRLLRRFGCAFVAEEEAQAGMPDLLLGLVICSMRVDEFLSALETNRLKKDVRRWGRRICRWPVLGLLPVIGRHWRKRHAVDALARMGLFKTYLEEGSQAPAYWEEDSDGRPTGAHWSQSVEVTLRSELGWTAEEINEAPLSKALADYFRFAESRGMIRLMTEWELEQIEGEGGGRTGQTARTSRTPADGAGEEVACGA